MAIDVGVLQTNDIDVGVFQSAGGTVTPINLTLNDAFSFSDGETLSNIAFNDTLNLTDAVNVNVPIFLTFSEAYSFSDDLGNNVGIPLLFNSDGLTLSDEIDVFYVISINLDLSDSLEFSDAFDANDSNPIILSDQLVLQDSIALSSLSLFDFIDSLNLSDSVQLLLAPIRDLQLTDELTLSDSINVSLLSIFTAINLSLNDTLSLEDGVGFTYPEKLTFSDSLSLDDSNGVIVVLMSDLNPYLRRYLNDVKGISNP